MTALRDIWEARNAGQVEQATALFDALCSEWGLMTAAAPDLPAALADLKQPDENLIDCLAIAASLARRQGQLSLSDDLLAAATAYKLHDRHFQWHYQKGLNALHQCQHLQAMRQFFSALPLARTSQEKYNAWIDGIICLEALGLPYVEHLANFRSEFADYAQEAWARSIAGQFRALQIREYYRSCNIEALAQAAQDDGIDDQSNYEIAWIASLPYIKYSAPVAVESRLVRNATMTPRKYLADFRLGTINNIGSDDETDESIKASEAIERLYLWTWRWLLQPSSFRARQLVQCKLLIDKLLGGQITTEDNLMLANALRWLGLFLGTPSSMRFDLLSGVQVHQSQRAVSLEYESLLLDYIYACRDEDTMTAAQLSTALMAHPLHGHPYFKLWEMFARLSGHPQSDEPDLLVEAVLDTFAIHHKDAVVVDLIAGTIEISRHGRRETIRSVQLARLLHLIERQDYVSASDVMKHCFEIRSYSPDIHTTKIASLLTRANQLFYGTFSFARRDATIHLTQRIGQIKITGASPQHLSLIAVDERFALLGKVAPQAGIPVKAVTAPKDLSKMIHSTSWISRTEVERLFGLSRSTVLRRLKEWEQAGHCIKRGIGKATRYKFREDFMKSEVCLS